MKLELFVHATGKFQYIEGQSLSENSRKSYIYYLRGGIIKMVK